MDIYRTVTEPVVDASTRGKAIHCSYKVRIHPPRDDWIVFLRFTRVKVGEVSPDRRTCDGGFIQIIDGYKDPKDSNISTKRVNPGTQSSFCLSPADHISADPAISSASFSSGRLSTLRSRFLLPWSQNQLHSVF